jgi:hypothetical protein
VTSLKFSPQVLEKQRQTYKSPACLELRNYIIDPMRCIDCSLDFSDVGFLKPFSAFFPPLVSSSKTLRKVKSWDSVQLARPILVVVVGKHLHGDRVWLCCR